MTCSFNYCTPINYRCTALTVSSAIVSVSCTCCLYVRKSYKLCIMYVPFINIIINFSSNGDRTAKRAKILAINEFYSTCQYLAINSNNGAISGCKLCCRSNSLTGYIVNTIPRPKSYRNANKCFVSRSSKCIAYSLNNKSKNIICSIQGICSLKSICNYNTLRLPSISCLKLQLGSELIDICHICYVNIYVIDRIIFRHIS